jgi:hypothetical protein
MAQAGPEVTAAVYSGNSTATLANLTTVTNGDLVIDSFAGGYNLNSTGKSASPNDGQAALVVQSLPSGGIIGGSSYEVVPTAGIVAVGWTEVVSRQAYSAVAFAPIPSTNYIVAATASPSNGGTVTISPSQASYASGTSITVTATPAPYYQFTGFSGDLTGSASPATVTVTANMSITANFTPTVSTLTVASTGHGTVAPASGSYACGTTITLNATPDSGYSFGQWVGGGYSGTNSAFSFVLGSNTTETASFVQGTAAR